MATDPRDRRDLDQPYAAFGIAMREARERQGIDRSTLAEHLGVSYPMVANIESGRRRLSEDLLEKLAPLLGVAVDELRALRDAASPPPTRNRDGKTLDEIRRSEPRKLSALDSDVLPDWVWATPVSQLDELNRRIHSGDEGSTAEALITRLLLQSQDLNALARASNPLGAAQTGRPDQLGDLLRDLRQLDTQGVDKVHTFVKGMLAAQDRETTAVDPLSRVPLVRVPSEPFGPLQKWTAPKWMRELPEAEVAEHQVRRLRERAGMFASRAHRPDGLSRRVAHSVVEHLSTLATGDDHTWPSVEKLAEAVEVGIYLNSARKTEELGFADARDWLAFVAYRPRPLDGTINTTLSLWITRITFIARATRSRDASELLTFTTQCMEFTNELLLPGLASLAPPARTTDTARRARELRAQRRGLDSIRREDGDPSA